VDQFLESVAAISLDERENFLGNRKDSTRVFIRKSVVENADFIRARNVPLDEEVSRESVHIRMRLLFGVDDFEPGSPLPHIRLED
jgi:hypothetical protein